MPNKDSTLTIGPRLNIISKDLYNKFIQETGSDITYTRFRTILVKSMSVMRSKMINNVMGLKLPYELGFAVVSRFKPDKLRRGIDWKRSKEYGTRVYFVDTAYGYKPRYNWLTSKMSKCKFITLYKFIPDREIIRGVGRVMAKGKEYNEFGHDYFRMRSISVNLTKLTDG